MSHLIDAEDELSDYQRIERTNLMRRISAEAHAPDLVQALKAAVDNAPCWQTGAHELLRRIAAGVLPEPA